MNAGLRSFGLQRIARGPKFCRRCVWTVRARCLFFRAQPKTRCRLAKMHDFRFDPFAVLVSQKFDPLAFFGFPKNPRVVPFRGGTPQGVPPLKGTLEGWYPSYQVPKLFHDGTQILPSKHEKMHDLGVILGSGKYLCPTPTELKFYSVNMRFFP